MKVKNLLFSTFLFCSLFFSITLNAQNLSKQNQNNIQGPPQRTCGTEIPSQQWEDLLQQKVAEFLAENPEISEQAKQGSGNSTQAVYTIPVIIHVIHGGQAVGTFPNLAQGQLNSQITVLNNDFAGVGQNVGNYPGTAFTTYATHTLISSTSKDALGRIKIANTGVTFCLALQDTLGNTLAEPGIHRVNYNTLPALTGTFTSKNPANAVYNTPGKLQGFINGYIKPNTIWNVRKYMNIWVSDQNAAVGLLGYATFPPLSGLIGIPGGVGTATTDGFWSWSAAFGSSTIFPAGIYAAPYDKGRTCTHEIGHWVGLRHIWGDGTCATDYCNDTPPAAGPNFGAPVYPVTPGSCAGPPSNSPNGEMAMNFMDYTDDLAMYMFTEDQRTRLQTAMLNSPYRNQLGTHGLCSVPPPTANFTISPNPICAGQTTTLTDLSTGSPGAWSYTTGGSPATTTLQSPSVTYTAAGVYSITLIATNGGGNSTPVIRTITVIAVPVLTVTPSPSTVCAGGSSTITASGATTYSWSTSATTSSIVVTPTANTIYTVTGANGTCVNTRTVLVAFSGNPTVNITPTSATICSGNSTTLTGSGATNYTWMPGGNTTSSVSVSPSITTTYTLTGANVTGCTATRTIQVTVNTTPTVNVVANPTLVCGGNSSTLTASGATTFSWNTSATTSSIVVTPTINTTYTVTGTTTGCSNTRTVSVTVSGSPTLNITPGTATICVGNSVSLSGSGATNYTWMPGGNTTTSIVVSPTITTTYTLTGTTAGGCSGTRTVQITVNPLPTVNINANPLTICPGSSSTLTATGSGSGPFSYNWNTGATTPAITTSVTGVYTATVTNGTGCSGSQSFTLNSASGLTITANSTPTSICAGGSVTLTANGAPTYTWSTGPTTSSIVVSPSVTTTYTVNGSNGSCSGTQTISVIVNPNPTITAVSNPSIMCSGQTSTITAGGATTYSWNTGATTAAIIVTPMLTTTYTVTGTNTFGCSNSVTVSAFIITSPTITVVSTPTSICSGNSATIAASGASTYTWNTGPTTSAIIVNPTITTSYTVTGSNGSGCTATRTISLIVNSNPTVNVTSSPTVICSGSSSTLSASGASTYSWNTGATSANIVVSPITSTNYTVTGFTGSCSNTRTISLNVNPTPTLNITPTSSAICLGTSVSLTGSGALNYTWMPGGITTASVSVSPTVNTTYTLTGTNAGGCATTRTVAITLLSSPIISVSANPTIICPGSSSTLTANGSGPPGPFSYLWNTGETNAVITTSLAGVYTASFTNGNGCKAYQSVTITVAPSLSVTATPTSICSGGSTTLTASGASTYTWNTGPTSSVIVVTPTTSTTYTVNGTNGACISSRSVSIVVNANPTINVVSNPTAVCAGNSSTLTASGAVTYSWSTGSTSVTSVVNPTITSTYTVIGTNASGCTTTRTISISVLSVPSISVTSSSTAICSGNSATLTASGANTYTWNTGSTTAAITVSPGITTTYTVTGTNISGCTATRTVSVVVNTTPTVNIISTPTTICAGSSASLVASGASTYSWNTSATTSSIIVTPTITSTYTVSGSNGSCSNTRTISITVNASPIIAALSSSSLICVGQSAVLTASSSAITYTWSTGSNSSSVSINPTVTTNYTVSGTNTAGCVGSTVISLSVSPCTGITSVANGNTNYSAYPNPNSGEFTVTVEKITENTFVEIYNTIGQLVSKQLVKDFSTKINLTEQANGVYYIIVTKEDKHLYKTKVIKD